MSWLEGNLKYVVELYLGIFLRNGIDIIIIHKKDPVPRMHPGGMAVHTPDGEQQVVVFNIGQQAYAVEIGWVREVVVWSEPVPLPGAPPAVQGVINLRGQVIPVIDLGQRLGMARCREGSAARIMVVELGERAAGLVVDGVSEVMTLPAEVVEPPSPVAQARAAERFVTGVARLPERMLVLIDLPTAVAEASNLDLVGGIAP